MKRQTILSQKKNYFEKKNFVRNMKLFFESFYITLEKNGTKFLNFFLPRGMISVNHQNAHQKMIPAIQLALVRFSSIGIAPQHVK